MLVGDSMSSLKLEHNRIMQDSLSIAYAVVALLGRKEDDITENEAFKTYGKKWIQSRTDVGLIHFNRIGNTSKSAKMYSRFEIETLKQAEKRIEEKLIQASSIVKELHSKTV